MLQRVGDDLRVSSRQDDVLDEFELEVLVEEHWLKIVDVGKPVV